MVYLIDASVVIFRAWHSLPLELQDAEGNPTQALYGFACFLGDLIERRSPHYLAALFDECDTGSFRHTLYPPYKANREPAPAALRRQFGLCREFCRHLGVAEFASPHFEADDLIGTLASRCRAEGLPVTVVSRDKDLAQLVGEDDAYWDYAGETEYGYHDIAARFGAAPERMADYLALRGDSVDNVPGVPGVGHKTAAALMRLYGSLDELFAQPELAATLPLRGAASLPERLRMHRAIAYRAQALTRIACNAPLPVSRSDLRRLAPDLTAIGAFCDRHRFGTLLRRQASRIHASAPTGSGL
jgi:5'-3' exonuclease